MTIAGPSCIASIQDLSAQLVANLPEVWTVSAIKCFINCPQQFFMKYVWGLEPRDTSQALVEGRLVHAGLESVLRLVSENGYDACDAYETAVSAWRTVDAKIAEIAPDLCAHIDIEYIRTRVHAMMAAWITANSDRMAEYKILYTEHPIFVQPFPVDDIPIILGGTPDGIVRNCRTGDVSIIEHKSAAAIVINQAYRTASLELDMQANFYLYLATIACSQGTLVLPGAPNSYIYDVIQKPQHRLGKNETHENLRNRMTQAMLQDSDKYCLWEHLVANHDTVRNTFEDFMIHVKQACRCARHPQNIARSTTHCGDYGACAYKALCSEGGCVRRPETIRENPAIHMYECREAHLQLPKE